MQLSNEQQQALQTFLQHWPDLAACPVCGSNDWSARSRLFEVAEYRDAATRNGAHAGGLPVVALTCQNCASVLLLDAVKAGVLKEPPKAERL